jgi:NAD(P)-dependent dehydrogenase (short-subunit alcohol dehydrogenase family)
MFRADLFKGKRFLVTGGGTGLGRIMMEKFVELGADCVICGRRGGVLEETARQVMEKHPGRRVDTHTVDIRVATAVEEMIERIWASGPLDGLVNNAAGNFISQTKDLSPRAFDAIANIVLHGTFYMTNACGKRWIADKRKASVISILTTWVWTGSPFVVPSACPRRASRDDPEPCRRMGPPRHPAERHRARPLPHRGRVGAAQSHERRRRRPLHRAQPDGPRRRPSELANMAAFLMSDEVEYINGEVIAIDGAMGIMGNGTFANMMAYSEDDWRRIREQIQSTNAADRAKRG